MMKKLGIILILFCGFSLHAADADAVPDWVPDTIYKLQWDSSAGHKIEQVPTVIDNRKAAYEQAISHTKDALRTMIADAERSFHFVPQWEWVYNSPLNLRMPEVANRALSPDIDDAFDDTGILSWMCEDKSFKEIKETAFESRFRFLDKALTQKDFMNDLYALACRTFAFVPSERQETPVMDLYRKAINLYADENTKHRGQMGGLLDLAKLYDDLTFGQDYFPDYSQWNQGTSQDRYKIIEEREKELAAHHNSLNGVVTQLQAAGFIPQDAPVYTQLNALKQTLDRAERKLVRRKNELEKEGSAYQELLKNKLDKPMQLEVAYEAVEIFDTDNSLMSPADKKEAFEKFITTVEQRNEKRLLRHERTAILKSLMVAPFLAATLKDDESIVLFTEKIETMRTLLSKGDVEQAHKQLSHLMSGLRDHPIGLLIEGQLGDALFDLQDEVNRRYHEQRDLRVVHGLLVGGAATASVAGFTAWIGNKYSNVPPSKLEDLPLRVRPFVRFARWIGWAKYAPAA